MGMMVVSRIVCVGAFFSALVGLFAHDVQDTTLPLMVSSGLGWFLFDREITAALKDND